MIRLNRAFNSNDIESEHYDSRPLGHAKLNTTALYTRVATSTIRKVMSPLDRLSLIETKKGEPASSAKRAKQDKPKD